MQGPTVRGILPKSMPGFIVLIFGMLVILVLPSSSKFISYRYVFSWSMYNGAWVHENYSLNYIDQTLSKTLSRDEVLDKFDINLLPYGLKPLKILCERENLLESITRDGRFPIEYYCSSDRREFE